MRYDKGHPYAFRTYIRQFLPWFLIDIGFMGKGEDCEKIGSLHSWYKIDDENSGCYHCKVTKKRKM